ncbi:MAG TPA: hypothetical protein VKH37_09280, partial [Ferruginibacter sp.]|nr:hypothetical protein [Ferruginibacter sp.]
MNNRRSFINKMGLLSAAALTANLPAWSKNLDAALKNVESVDPSLLASDEDFWYFIQQSYSIAPDFVNLNNGGVSPAPKPVAEAVKRYYDMCNEGPSYYMWRILDQGREPLRKNLAQLAGVD